MLMGALVSLIELLVGYELSPSTYYSVRFIIYIYYQVLSIDLRGNL